jgi:hypothetical protein
MLKILGRASSINVQKVMWLTAELGLEVERVDIGGPFGGNDQPDYLAKNPMGRAISPRPTAAIRGTPPIRTNAPSPASGWTGRSPICTRT